MFGYDEFVIQGYFGAGLRGHGVHVGCIAEVHGGRAIGDGFGAMEHLPRCTPSVDGHLNEEKRLGFPAPKTTKGVMHKKTDH